MEASRKRKKGVVINIPDKVKTEEDDHYQPSILQELNKQREIFYQATQKTAKSKFYSRNHARTKIQAQKDKSNQQQFYARLGNVEFQKIVKLSKRIKMLFDKLSFNLVSSPPVEFNPYEEELNYYSEIQSNFDFRLSDNLEIAIKIFKLFYIVCFIFFLPLSFNFQEIRKSSTFLFISILGLVLVLIDIKQFFRQDLKDERIILSLKKINQEKKKKLWQLSFNLFISLTQLMAVILNNYDFSNYLQLFMLLKVFKYSKYISDLEVELLTGSIYEKYWDLFKIFLSNLLVCHIVASILLSVANSQPQFSWMDVKNIQPNTWFEKYVWSYYFGITILLTIGFGDFHATNHNEALVIIFVSIFSCIFFGYNLNYIGSIINSIRQQENQKNQKLKLLNSLAKKMKISNIVKKDVEKFIVEEARIKKNSNFEEEKQMLQQLPEDLRSSFLQESNEKLFKGLRKIIPLTHKTIEKMSLQIQARICHPGQFIKKIRDKKNLIILRSGEVGFTTLKRSSQCNNIIIQRISNTQKSQSKLVCTDFLLNHQLNYEIKSLDYSVIYEMSQETFEIIIRGSRQDLQIYRETMDKCRHLLDEFGIVKCQFCKRGVHTFFECPKLHFTPFKSIVHVKSKNKFNKKQQKQKRITSFKRNKNFIYLDERALQFQIQLSQTLTKDISQKKIMMRRSRQSSDVGKHLQLLKILRQDIKQLRNPVEKEKFGFDLWETNDCDEAYNFKHYFPKFNPNNLYNCFKPKEIKSKSNLKFLRRNAKALFNFATTDKFF